MTSALRTPDMTTPEAIRTEHTRLQARLANDNEQAVIEAYEDYVKNMPPSYDLWVCYAAFLNECKKYQDAADIAQRALDLQVTGEALYYRAKAIYGMGRMNDAAELFRKAVHLNPADQDSHYALGLCYAAKGEYEKAVDHYQIAVNYVPAAGFIWAKLARARFILGRYREALSATRMARKGGVDSRIELFRLYADCFRVSLDYDISRQLVDEVTMCLNSKVLNPDHLGPLCEKLFKHQPVIKAWLNEEETGGLHPDIETLLEDRTLNWTALNHEVFTSMLRRLKLHSQDFELFFTELRKHSLQWAVDGTVSEKLWPDAEVLLAGLACQSFLNEYLFFESPEDKKNIAALEQKIIADIAAGNIPDRFDVAILGCFKPLYKYDFAEKFLALADDPALNHLIRMQVREPLAEEQIKTSIPVLTTIDDSVSQLVKQQYEENPYPRWVEADRNDPVPFSQMARERFSFLDEKEFAPVSRSPMRHLIAGCGTGHQVVSAVEYFNDSEYLAVDLSASSLAYAIRKCQESSITNVEFGIADILRLRELGRKFDMIHCGGVLHHMNDPLAGWRVLYDCLEPGGFMFIGLYSDTARQCVVAAREFIKQNKFDSTPDGIRACREVLKILPKTHPARGIMKAIDFYSLSMCRDFIFHVQEHRFTIPRLQKIFKDMNLRFLGFDIPLPDIYQHYQNRFPDDPTWTNLDNWHQFEQENPDMFFGMYQIWLQKL